MFLSPNSVFGSGKAGQGVAASQTQATVRTRPKSFVGFVVLRELWFWGWKRTFRRNCLNSSFGDDSPITRLSPEVQ